MIPWITKLFTDETVFERLLRAALMFGALLAPQLTDAPQWVSAIGAALAVFIGIGEKNPPEVEDVIRSWRRVQSTRPPTAP